MAKDKSQLDEFRNMIDNCNDKESLDAAYQLLADVLKINKLKYELQELESGLTSGKKAMFYFFASGLNEDEVVFATERVKGKITRIVDAEKKKAEAENKEVSSQITENS